MAEAQIPEQYHRLTVGQINDSSMSHLSHLCHSVRICDSKYLRQCQNDTITMIHWFLTPMFDKK